MTTHILQLQRATTVVQLVRTGQHVVRLVRTDPPSDAGQVIRLVSTATGIVGPPGPAGPAGPAGPQGPAGPTGVVDPYVFHAVSPVTEWLINHNLGRKPAVHLYSTGSIELYAHVVHLTENAVLVTFNQPQAGFAHLY